MEFVIFRKSDLQIVRFSTKTDDPNHTGDREIGNYVLATLPADQELTQETLEAECQKYAFVEITDEQTQHRLLPGRRCWIEEADGVYTFVIKDPVVYVCFRKSDLQIVGFSGLAMVEYHTGEWEIEHNVLPNFGGSMEDYGYIEISEEQSQQRIGRQVSIEFVDGEPTFIIGEPIPVPPPQPTKVEELEAENATLQQRIATLQEDNLYIMEILASNNLA